MFVYGFMFKMHPIVYLLSWNNIGGFGGQNGVYAARFVGDRGADKRQSLLHILFSKLKHPVS